MTNSIDAIFDYATDHGWEEDHRQFHYSDDLHLRRVDEPGIRCVVNFRSPNRVSEAFGWTYDHGIARRRQIFGGVPAVKKFLREAK